MAQLGRRAFLLGAVAVGAAACGDTSEGMPGMHGMHGASGAVPPTGSVPPAPALTPTAGQNVVRRSLAAAPARVDLGGVSVDTWAYDGQIPGPLLRARTGDFVQVDVRNALPADTTVHWHGIRLRNPADGLPGVTQNPIAPGASYSYQFVPPDPGTYFFHPHVGVQLDRGLYAPLLIDDPAEPGDYDHEWVLVLDDWIDGTGTTPDDVLARLQRGGGTDGMSGMSGMGGMGHMTGPGPWGSGDVTYPYFLINGRLPSDPDVLRAKPGDRVRLRIINAGSDTIFAVGVAGHRMTLTHTDGWPVMPHEVSSVYVGMGERYDAVVTLGDGAFPVVAQPFAKPGRAAALIRTASGAPTDLARVDLGATSTAAELQPGPGTLLAPASPDLTVPARLTGSMMTYVWGINGAPYGRNRPLEVKAGQRVRVQVSNMTMMTHPVHLHGHTFALPSGLRKDTVLVRPMDAVSLDFDADNAGDWMLHCHNAYHGEAGMMVGLNYV